MAHRGWWNDGRSARRTEVCVRLFGRRLIVSRDGGTLAELPVGGLRLAEEVYAGQPVRMKHDDWPDARLTVDDHALLARLTAVAPHLERRFYRRHGMLQRVLLWGGALAGTVAALVGAVHFGAAPIAALVPLEWEQDLGEQIMTGFVRSHGSCDGPGIAHLQRLAEDLAAVADSPYEFEVSILQSSEVNAFVLPGGQVALFRGLIEEADGPNELAGVLAHEVAHGTERHALEQMVRRGGYGLLATLFTGDMSGFAALAGDSAALVASMANSRADEAEADRLAMRLLNGSGIDSHGLPQFFARLSETRSSMPAAFAVLSTHPPAGSRLRETRALARPGRAAFTDDEWNEVVTACRES